jgi:cytochrome c2
MPASEQIWRNPKRMHLIFAISSVLMLLTTVWMLAADHHREWKAFQRTFRDVETWSIESRIQQTENEQYKRELADREAALEDAQHEVPSRELVDNFKQTLVDSAKQRDADPPYIEPIDKTYQDLSAAAEAKDPALVAQRRSQLIGELEQFVADARFRENNFLREKKFQAAFFDVDRSQYELGVGNELTPKQLEQIEEQVQKTKAEVDRKNQLVEVAKQERQDLEHIVGEVLGREVRARKALEDQLATLDQLEKARYDRANNGWKELFSLPIIDAFGRPLKIEQIWLPKLTINNNFSDVARFDRCTTCHQGLDKTAPGSAVEPAYRPQQNLDLLLATFAPPADAEAGSAPTAEELAQLGAAKEEEHAKLAETLPPQKVAEECLDRWFGLRLADRGLIHADDVTISVVRPESLGAKAGFLVGDVLRNIEGAQVFDNRVAYRYLVDGVNWGQPLQVSIRRGLPNPYTSHPRLDLFVGSLSPHKLDDVGCTICHEGQGSATDFKWASHSANSPLQGEEWRRDYGWFANHHWIFPMNPKRFAESSCLKCHHEVVDLEASERFPEPPAPKLLAGYDLIRNYGCYGCHEINGFDGPTKRIGPDLRTEPNYSAAAQALLATGQLKGDQLSLAETLVQHPDDEKARHTLALSIRYPATEDPDAAGTADAAAPASASPLVRRLNNVLDDVESPGKLRKVGPSLRHVADKLDYDFLYSWIRKPKDFRPTTKMPQFFGLWDHLDGPGLEASERFEPIEIRGIVAYLLTKSQPFDQAKPASGVEQASADRGKQLFETRGCLACHQHADFPQGKMKQGPNLTNLGGKLGREGNPVGQKWLYSWLKNPSNYHPRTLMPNLLLEPLPTEKGAKTDPAADLAAFLLSSKDWKPTAIPGRDLNQSEREALRDLAIDHLKNAYPTRQAKDYVEHGIPESMAGEIKGDEVELVGTGSVDKQLLYVGRRSISKYGCSGCHDVPGYEDAKPIGTGLADWGRKGADKLAFEQITQYILRGHGHAAHGDNGHGDAAHGDSPPGTPDNTLVAENVDLHDAAYVGPQTEEGMAEDVELLHAEGGHHLDFKDLNPSTGYFMKKLFGHEREGFIWQKLRAPRSYDYKKTENKGYNERLRMPQFNINPVEREEVITFVLGLVAEPPAQQYIYKPTRRRSALVEGSKVIDKFNCKGCHAFQMDRWDLAYAPGDFADPPKFNDYAFLDAHFTPQQIAASLKADSKGLRHASLVGMPVFDEKTGQPERLDSEGSPIEADDADSPVFERFVLYESTLVNGKVRPSGLQNLLVPLARVEKRFPTPEQLRSDPAGFGGYLPRLIFADVLKSERASNPNAKPEDVWAWLPPPLADEGHKVQTDWLHDFLLDPQPIRPAVVLRMPKFNMSSAEASALVAYFAAADNAEYPYDFDPRTRAGYLASQAEKEDNPHRLPDALKIIVDNNYCVKCHLLGDFEPTGSDRAKGPRLDLVYRRLRPDYTLSWIADPKRILPYTAMPTNIPPDKPVSESLYHGTSLQQINGVVDLLMNFDRFLDDRTSMKPLIKPAPTAAPEAAAPPESGARLPREEKLQ